MVKVSATEYDGGNDGGNVLVTKLTEYIRDSDTGKRETSYEHDVYGRTLLQTNATPPHSFNKYDHLGRLIASGQFSSTASIDVDNDDPTTETS